jgi:hypothetical protein
MKNFSENIDKSFIKVNLVPSYPDIYLNFLTDQTLYHYYNLPFPWTSRIFQSSIAKENIKKLINLLGSTTHLVIKGYNPATKIFKYFNNNQITLITDKNTYYPPLTSKVPLEQNIALAPKILLAPKVLLVSKILLEPNIPLSPKMSLTPKILLASKVLLEPNIQNIYPEDVNKVTSDLYLNTNNLQNRIKEILYFNNKKFLATYKTYNEFIYNKENIIN